MSDKVKGILINGIIRVLNEQIKKENKRFCEQNLYSMQKPLHGADMFFKLAYMNDDEVKDIALKCGL